MKIVLLGYMASGKSLIGKMLADVLKCEFIDLDNYIEVKESKDISNVFFKKGEIYFRRIEHESLKSIIKHENNLVLSLGGGTPCYYNNMKVIQDDNNIVSIYLNVTINTIVNRLEKEVGKRPLLAHIKNKNELLEFVGKHLFERSKFYRNSNLIIDANSEPHEIVEKIIAKLF